MRLVVWGAWVRSEHRWRFRATRGARLADRPASSGGFEPLVIREAPAPADARVPSLQDGAGTIVFAVAGAPRRFGDGWLIADPGTKEANARLVLPGERRIYGGQGKPAAGETWKLVRDQVYFVEIRRFRRRADRLPLLRARGVPRRVSGPVPAAAADPDEDD
jgi:hypothetical protein